MNVNPILAKCEKVLSSCTNVEQVNSAVKYVGVADQFIINNGGCHVVLLPSVVFKAKIFELINRYADDSIQMQL